MTAEPYKNVRLVVGDPDAAFAKTVASAIFPLGLRDISVCRDGDGVRQATAMTVDVVACDTNLPKLDFKAFAQDVRHGRVGANPFVVLIATARDEAEAQAERIAASGIDELILKPLNPLLLVRRIGVLAKDRKAFVITPGYVGPSRRAARRNDGSDDAALSAVPNTLRARMIERRDAVAIDGLVQQGRATMEAEKAASGLKVIARLTKQLISLNDKGAPVDDSRAALHVLSRMAQEVTAQHKASDAANHVSSIAERIGRLAARGAAAPNAAPRSEIELLTKLSDAAGVALAAANGHAAVPEIVAVVDGYLLRPSS